MTRVWTCLSLAVASCVTSASVTCPDGRTCPVGTVCVDVAASSQRLCVDRAQLAACEAAADGTPCEVEAVAGTCYSGACLPAGCGNLRIDAGEACDDGANLPGDGCSADCASRELCGNGIVDPVRIEGGELVPSEQCDDGGVVGHDGCSNTCRPETPRWQQVPTTAPPARARSAVVHDASSRRVVLFGGGLMRSQMRAEPEAAYGDTWEWDGSGWYELESAISPPPRYDHALAYDAARRRVVLFGGSNGNPLADTWELVGNAWIPIEPAVYPPPRAGHAMAYHPRMGVVMFGGRDASGNVLRDLWAWDGTTWSEVAVAGGPPGRWGHAMAFDPVRGVIVMTGHQQPSSADTWELDGVTWRLAAPPGATPQRWRAALAYDPVVRQIVLLGGLDPGSPSSKTHRWNGVTWTEAPVSVTPPARAGASAANDPATGHVLLVGGYSYPPACGGCPYILFQDTWLWDGSAWGEVAFPTIGRRTHAAVAFDRDRGHVIVFGGRDGVQSQLDETWELAGRIWARRSGAMPPARWYAAMAYDAMRGSTLLFGGRTGASTLGDTWSWNGSAWTARAVATAPPARSGHAMVYDDALGRVVLFGGLGIGGLRADTWEWTGGAWVDVTPAGASPPAREGHAMVFDPIRRRVVVFGGRGAAGELGDLWEWDGVAWSDVDFGFGPSPRTEAGMAWDATRRRAVVFGGAAGLLTSDAWEWDGSTWKIVAVGGAPAPRRGHAVHSAIDGGVLALGGTDELFEVLPADIYRLRWDAFGAPYESCRTDSDGDGDGLAGCDDPDCWAVCTPACPPGASCEPTAPRCGDATCNLDLEDCRICPGDCACTPWCGDFACDPPESPATCASDCPT